MKETAIASFLDDVCETFHLDPPNLRSVASDPDRSLPKIYRTNGWLLSFDDVWPPQTGAGPHTGEATGTCLFYRKSDMVLVGTYPHDRARDWIQVRETVVKSPAGLIAALFHQSLSAQIRDRVRTRDRQDTLRPRSADEISITESVYREEADDNIAGFLAQSPSAKSLASLCFEGATMHGRLFPKLSVFDLSELFG